MLFCKKGKSSGFNVVVFLASGMTPQATVFLEWIQRASSAMCVPVDIFQILF